MNIRVEIVRAWPHRAESMSLQLPDGVSTAMWIVGRSAGWVAHVTEQRTQAFMLRPRAKYGFGGPVSAEAFETPASR